MLTHKPIGFEGTVCWKDSPDSQDYFYFSFSEELLNHEGQPAEQDLYGVFDEFIFFYLDDAQQESLHKAIEKNYVNAFDIGEEWFIDLSEPYEFIYELTHQED